MKYPAIYKSVEGSEYLYQNKDSYYCYERQVWDSSKPYHDCHHSDKNITAEYLANTYGEVKSKEHAEFIVELCQESNIPVVYSVKVNDAKSFMVSHGCLNLLAEDAKYLSGGKRKQITIPLPPECESVDEWPKIGGEVQTSDGVGTVKLLPDSKGYYVISIKDEYYQYQLDELSKLKTPEQELRDELVEFIDRNDSVWKGENHHNPVPVTVHEFIADAILSKYNITKKGEGDE